MGVREGFVTMDMTVRLSRRSVGAVLVLMMLVMNMSMVMF